MEAIETNQNGITLLPDQDLSSWESITFGKRDAEWKLNNEGILTQNKRIGSTQSGTGTLLINKAKVISNQSNISVRLKPGSIYVSGMVFNYLDPDNYNVVLIDQKSDTSPDYDLAVLEVKNNVKRFMCKETYTNQKPQELIFSVIKGTDNLIINANNKLLYDWPDASLQKESQIGLYSQNNTDSEFISLIATDQSKASTIPQSFTGDTITQKLPEIISQDPIETIIPISENEIRIKDTLNIKPPKTKSIVEFKEGFKVSLDSFYSNLFLNSQLSRPKEKDFSNKTSISVLLDYRPKRWYNEYKNILDAQKLAQNDVKRYQTVLDDLENDGAYPQEVDYEEHDSKITEYRKKYLIAQDKFEQLAEEKNILFQEMRVAGYMVREENVPDHIKELGYDFYIVGGIAGYKDFAPIDIHPDEELENDTVWKKVEGWLRKSLFENKRFSELSRKKYEDKSPYLENDKGFYPLIEDKLAKIDEEINVEERKINLLNTQVYSIKNEIDLWEADKALLSQYKDSFDYYSSGAYPSSGWGSGNTNSSNFRNWLITNQNAFKVFQFSFLSSGYNIYLDINQYEEFVWRHHYAFSTSTYTHYKYVPANSWEEWNLAVLGWPGTKKVFSHYETIYHNSFAGDANIPHFFSQGSQICDHYINNLLPKEIESLKSKIATANNSIIAIQFRKQDIIENSLRIAREEFIDQWNRADVIDLTISGENTINPNLDPLTQLMGELKSNGETAKIYYIQYQSDGFYTQDGQSLQDFVDIAHKLPYMVVLIVPVFDNHGRQLEEVSKAVINPVRSGKLLKLPSISFVETYQMEVMWKGYCQGELTKTISLFPGETKELVVETKTRLNEKLTETDQSESTQSTKTTDSFEERLQNEMSEKNLSEQSQSSKQVNDRKNTVSRVITDEQAKIDSSKLELNLGATSSQSVEAGGSYSGASGSAKQGKSKNQGLSMSIGSEKRDIQKDTKTNALHVTQNQTNQKANKESREALKKSLSNTFKKTASETSANNKVSFTSVKSSEFEESTSEKETINIENPNIGRTVNYNFFQIQNIYENQVKMVDVKIVIDPGIEVIKNSELTDLRVFDLEEFGKVYANSDEKDPRSALLSAIITRQVMKNYDGLTKANQDNKSLMTLDPIPLDKDIMGILNLSGDWDSKKSIYDALIAPIKEALTYLKSRSFKFTESILIPKTEETINAGSYYMDAEVGRIPATEQYLEDRRDIETKTKRAELQHKRAQTSEKVFFPEIPEGVTSLELDNQSQRNSNLTN